MVYCGKASLGCQGCRTRRIKCDRVRPECSQCMRASKKCPGYRDQLSLMFRDESSKVMQKAHAQWGVTEAPPPIQPASRFAGSEASCLAPRNSPSPSPSSSPSSSSTSSSSSSPAGTHECEVGNVIHSPWPVEIDIIRDMLPARTTVRLTRAIYPNTDETGLHFFVSRYLINQPDAPCGSLQLDISSPDSQAMQNVMVAVGLAGLANTRGDRAMGLMSRQKYTLALRQMGQVIASRPVNAHQVMSPLRSIVTLALFEVVQGKGSSLSTGTVNIHILGAIALLRSALQAGLPASTGARGILQLLFSLFIPAQVHQVPLPANYFDTVGFCRELLPESEHSCCELAIAVAKFLHISAPLKHNEPVDDQTATDQLLQELLGLEDEIAWVESQLERSYSFTVHEADSSHAAAAVFDGKYHLYTEIWAARLWNHLRWLRILVNQTILELSERLPLSASRLVSPARRQHCLATIRRMAYDVLVSTPSHWHHPLLTNEQSHRMEAVGKGGSGAVGLPSLLWHLKVAGCAPGVPRQYFDWCYAVMQVVWGHMGMDHASMLSVVMAGHRSVQEETIDRILKIEHHDC